MRSSRMPMATVRHPAMILFGIMLMLVLLSIAPPAQALSNDVVISEVYGGGGNNEAQIKSDFIELKNNTNAPINVSGWSIQYASAAGAVFQMTNLSGSIPANGHYLIQQASGAGGTLNLPTPDATGSIPMSATSGVVALVTAQLPLVACGISCSTAPNVKDLVGYGSTANVETLAAPGLTNSTSATRSGSMIDTDNNSVDFTSGLPTPTNSAGTSVIVTQPTNTPTSTATNTPEPPTNTPTSTATSTPTNTPVPPTNTPTTTPTSTPVPINGVLDTFNRANGKVGANWDGLTATSFYKIASNKLEVQIGGLLVWKTSFGTSQEAFVTLSSIDKYSLSQGVLLKVQDSGVMDAGAISVVYDAIAKAVRVSTLRVGAKTWTIYGNKAVTFANGDVLGARVSNTGIVEVTKNGTIVATITLNTADKTFFNSKGGRIGIWTTAAPNAVFDDFGGGTLTP